MKHLWSKFLPYFLSCWSPITEAAGRSGAGNSTEFLGALDKCWRFRLTAAPPYTIGGYQETVEINLAVLICFDGHLFWRGMGSWTSFYHNEWQYLNNLIWWRDLRRTSAPLPNVCWNLSLIAVTQNSTCSTLAGFSPTYPPTILSTYTVDPSMQSTLGYSPKDSCWLCLWYLKRNKQWKCSLPSCPLSTLRKTIPSFLKVPPGNLPWLDETSTFQCWFISKQK